MGQTIAEKVFSAKAGRVVRAGEPVTVPVDCAVIHDEAFARTWRELNASGLGGVWDLQKVVVVLDHGIPADSERTAGRQMMVRKVVEALGLTHYYGEGEGVSHQVAIDKGHVRPGALIVGACRQTCAFGALGAAGAQVETTEMAQVLTRGELAFTVPNTTKITLTGHLPSLVTAMDVFLLIAGKYGTELTQNGSIEFDDKGVEGLSVEGRLTISGMMGEIGPKFAFFDVDKKTLGYLKGQVSGLGEGISADPDASYTATYEVDMTGLEPQIAYPHAIANVKPVSAEQGKIVNQAIIGPFSNARYEDLKLAAETLKGRKVARFTRLYIFPPTRDVYLRAMHDGVLTTLAEAGAVICNPSWGPCAGGQIGLLAPSEICITSNGRNSEGCLGSAKAEVYAASAATVAASAMRGVITDPRELNN